MDGIGCVNPQLGLGETVSPKNERLVQSTVKILEESNQLAPILIRTAPYPGAEESNGQRSAGTSSFGNVK
jgi:hypothetical protein